MAEARLLAVPNFSEGRSERVVDSLGATLAAAAELLDTHLDADHNRCVFTLCGEPGRLEEALLAAGGQAVELIDLSTYEGRHPCVGALDVCPIVWRSEPERELARAAARRIAERLAAELELPVFLYGELASSEQRRERGHFRRGGLAELARRMEAGELRPDFGPPRPHPTAGATLVTARRPLVAFNLELDTPDADVAAAVAGELREAAGGLPGVRAIGLPRPGGRSQVSFNIHDPERVPLARVVEETQRIAAAHGAAPVEAELVGLAPEVALEGYPETPPIVGFDPERHLIERRLR